MHYSELRLYLTDAQASPSHFKHMLNVCAEDHIALGSDFDGAPIEDFPKGMSEFDEYKWWKPETLLHSWLNHEVRLPPPQVTLVRDICQAIKENGDLISAFDELSKKPSEGYHILEFAPGVE